MHSSCNCGYDEDEKTWCEHYDFCQRIEHLEAENSGFRVAFAAAISGPGCLDVTDGELYDGEQPYVIDFKRDSITDILEKLKGRSDLR